MPKEKYRWAIQLRQNFIAHSGNQASWTYIRYLESVYESFNIISYFSPALQVQLLERLKISDSKSHSQFIFTISDSSQRYLLESSFKDCFHKNLKQKQELKIQYRVAKVEEGHMGGKIPWEGKIKVKISYEFCENQDGQSMILHEEDPSKKVSICLKIEIEDCDNWIDQNLNKKEALRNFERISGPIHISEKEIEYFYQQPAKQRVKQIDKEHFNIAFQGGGAKGLQYIGVYQALKELSDRRQEGQIKVRSIVASSAGCLFGLAVACGISPERLRYFCVNNLINLTEQPTFATAQNEDLVREYIEEIMRKIQSYHILDSQLIEVIQKLLKNENFKQNLVQLIKIYSDETMMKIFTYYDDRDKLNLQGLFHGVLLKGNCSKKLILDTLIEFFTINKDKKEVLEYVKGKDQDVAAEQLTMSQLYQMTGIQFTCTVVDLQNKIPRILNKKTTPNLPVCMAVVMSSSFPIAFQAQSWKQQWGNYYIHYENIRRQIKLTGVRFTDGGFLSNFPIHYLDNEEMRPMYFSHKMNHYTKMYGFGINTMKPAKSEETRMKENEKAQQIIENLKKIVIKQIGYCQLLSTLFCYKCSPKKKETIDMSQTSSKFNLPPLFSDLKDLFQIFQLSRDRFPEECFAHSVFYTPLPKQYFQEVRTRQSIKLSNLFQQLRELENIVIQIVQDKKKEKEQEQWYKIFVHYFQSILKQIKKEQKTEFKLVEWARYLQKIIMNLSGFHQEYLIFLRDQNQFKMNQKTQEQVNKQTYDHINRLINQKQKKSILSYSSSSQDLFKRILNKLRRIQKSQIFVFSKIDTDFSFLTRLTEGMVKFFGKFRKDNESFSEIPFKINCEILQHYMGKYYFRDIQKLQNLLNHISDLCQKIQHLQSKKKTEEKQKIIQERIRIYSESKQCGTKLIQFVESSMNRGSCEKIKKLSQKLRKSKIIYIFINAHASIRGFQMQKFVQKMIQTKQRLLFLEEKQFKERQQYERYLSSKQKKRKKGKLSSLSTIFSQSFIEKNPENVENVVQLAHKPEIDGIHVMLESIPFSHYYFHEYYKHIKVALLQINNRGKVEGSFKNLKITSMTATGYYCLAMFLYASDFRDEKISNEIFKMDYLINVNKQRMNEFLEGKWTQKKSSKIRQLQKKVIQQKRNIFKLIGGKIKKIQRNNDQEEQYNLMNEMEEELDRIKQDNFDIIEAINSSYDFISDEIKKVNIDKNDSKKQINRKLDIIAEKIGEKQQKYDEKYQKQLKKVINIFQERFLGLIKYVTYTSPLQQNYILKTLNKGDRKQAWKGILMGNLLESISIKDFVKRNLKEMNLDQNTNLITFYEATNQKILLNFPVINTQNDHLTIINAKTRPYMPIWAAALACCSQLGFMPSLLDNSSWASNQVQNSGLKRLRNYFEKENENKSDLISSHIITRLPMAYLTNNKLKEKITDTKNEVIIALNFSEDQQSGRELYKEQIFGQDHIKQEIVVYPLGLKDIFNYFGSILNFIVPSRCFQTTSHKNFIALSEYLFCIPQLNKLKKTMEIYLNSNDQFVRSLYKDNVAELPIRYQTLEFHLICDPQQRKKCSNICVDAIMQAKYLVKEKFLNSNASDPRFLFIRIQSPNQGFLHDGEVKISNNKYPLIRFLSMSTGLKSLYEQFKIFYRFREGGGQNMDNRLKNNFRELKSQYLLMKGSIIEIIMEYPVSYGGQQKYQNHLIKKAYFVLDCLNFTRILSHRKNNEATFGFVYEIQFTKLFPKNGQILTPQDSYRNYDINIKQISLMTQSLEEYQDQMDARNSCTSIFKNQNAKNHNQESYPQIKISSQNCPSQILNEYDEPFCDQCHCYLEFNEKFKCHSCSSNFQQRAKFSLSSQSKFDEIRCSKNHILVKIQCDQSKEGGKKLNSDGKLLVNTTLMNNIFKTLLFVTTKRCSICHEYSQQMLWEDKECSIKLCKKCLRKLQIKN